MAKVKAEIDKVDKNEIKEHCDAATKKGTSGTGAAITGGTPATSSTKRTATLTSEAPKTAATAKDSVIPGTNASPTAGTKA